MSCIIISRHICDIIISYSKCKTPLNYLLYQVELDSFLSKQCPICFQLTLNLLLSNKGTPENIENRLHTESNVSQPYKHLDLDKNL